MSQSSTNPNVEVVFGEKEIEELDESTHYNSVDLVRKINELIRKGK